MGKALRKELFSKHGGVSTTSVNTLAARDDLLALSNLLTGWLKNISQLGRIIPYILWQIKFMFETTNQFNHDQASLGWISPIILM